MVDFKKLLACPEQRLPEQLDSMEIKREGEREEGGTYMANDFKKKEKSWKVRGGQLCHASSC
jgi:hypothetical protein